MNPRAHCKLKNYDLIVIRLKMSNENENYFEDTKTQSTHK